MRKVSYVLYKIGKPSEINYNECKSQKLKTKVRRFSNLIQKLSSGDDEQD